MVLDFTFNCSRGIVLVDDVVFISFITMFFKDSACFFRELLVVELVATRLAIGVVVISVITFVFEEVLKGDLGLEVAELLGVEIDVACSILAFVS